MHTKTSRAFLALLLVGTLSGHLSADVVETKNGARIVGKVISVDTGSVIVDTDYAGKVTIKQSQVTAITTDEPVAVRLKSGTHVDGKIVATGDTGLQIAASEGTITTKVEDVAATWKFGDEDPAVVALRHHWAYEASADVTGTSGNKNQLGTAGSFRATLITPRDTLAFYTGYNRQVTEGEKSADQFKAGTDYANNFRPRVSWYVRDEGGFDRIKDIDIYNVAATGFGYDFIKEAKHLLTGRIGLSFRYENYQNPVTTDVKSAGMDFGVNHEYTFGISKLVNRLSWVPAFEDFGNYRLTHESTYEIPLANPAWKLCIGLSNDYNSKPGPGLKRLDTAYFTRLLLNWK